jgi:RimJ/RimL family protein N-acetyltransferase
MTQAALPILRTPRLELRPLQEDDADAIARGVGNFDVSKWLAVVPYPYNEDDARSFLARVSAQDKPFWAICNAYGLKGVISLDDELAYWLARDVWGKGYGIDAAVAVVDHWFADPVNDRLGSGYFDGNDRSGDLLRALGFTLAERTTRYAKSFQQDVISNQMVLARSSWEARQNFTLYTPRLTLRPLQETDAAAFAAMMVPEVTRMLARLKTGMTEEEARADMPRRRWRGHIGFTLAIEKEGQMIGTLGVGGAPVSLGYFLAPDYWGQGLMTEALSAFLPEVFAKFPLSTLYADHFEDNPASGAILEKLGFDRTGREMGTSVARVEQAALITYALQRDKLRVPV